MMITLIDVVPNHRTIETIYIDISCWTNVTAVLDMGLFGVYAINENQ
ncbi:hypothetical protein B6N60_03397 [Richelia sinica FACHB-800]|uniref:Uncharacterized protein n=1 Tax=Richelia sinica FACHB-800 TaxID=1357546 RepID=A0A975Y5X4_9NOST|nr:hypothetical protein [Richelia sinica]MBD2663504.1 hypothetical protein [Richelia sinica FACHB-800]QXE24690.1 hypothetical protein B6N60_03397 [Richelia sinica FACHB-800]